MEQMERSPLGTGGALEAPRGRRDGRSAGGEEEDGEERRGGICSGEGARVMRPPLPRSGGGGRGARAERRPPAGDWRVEYSSIGGREPHAPARGSSSGGDGRRRSRAHADSDQMDCPSLVSAPSDGRARASQANWLRVGGWAEAGARAEGGRRGQARRSTLSS
jgi:hypothetical protein